MRTVTLTSEDSDPSACRIQALAQVTLGMELFRIVSHRTRIELLTSTRVVWEHTFFFTRADERGLVVHGSEALSVGAMLCRISNSDEPLVTPAPPTAGLVLSHRLPPEQLAPCVWIHRFFYSDQPTQP